ncbi:MAG TPA: DUF2306 domain-containing protein [Sphingomonas sp.]|nr:DUF2306 domain-containing protein [Sphingomonas sp.]
MASLADPDHGVPMRGVGRLLRRLIVATLFLLTLVTLITHERYVLRADDPMWRHLAPFRWWLLPHVAGGMIAFLAAPFQFSATFRRRWPAAHRWVGRTYMVAVVVSSILSIYIVLAFELQANWWVMGTMGALWLVTTLFAWLAIRNGNVTQHRLWIGRSFGLTFTFVLTRIVPDLMLPGLDYVKMTALYWAFIVASLIVPDLLVNGRALLPWRRRLQ